jgi:hypothetical protein
MQPEFVGIERRLNELNKRLQRLEPLVESTRYSAGRRGVG